MLHSYEISCLCRTIHQTVTPRLRAHGTDLTLSLCHCDACRYSSGALCTSFYPIDEPKLSPSLQSLASEAAYVRFFCSICGCHVFRCKETAQGRTGWDVSTGVVVSSEGHNLTPTAYTAHVHASDSKDGGASVWMPAFSDEETGLNYEPTKERPSHSPPEQKLQASCACGTVRFHITRPQPSSYEPHSDYPDLMLPAKTTPASVACNPEREKWWIQARGTKYLAGTCACRSCRLATGFEIQTWAFIPKTNIFMHIPDSGGGETITVPLDFSTLPAGVLQTYSSSPGVLREFCAKCGATVFWHNDTRAGIIDVSVGLLRADEGARAESWLHWWTARVSFQEDTELSRQGPAAQTARNLITALENGLEQWKQED